MIPNGLRAIWHVLAYWRAGKPVIAPKSVVESRRGICAGCPQNDRAAWPMCLACNCFIEPKTQLSSESCPVGRWVELDEQSITNQSQ